MSNHEIPIVLIVNEALNQDNGVKGWKGEDMYNPKYWKYGVNITVQQFCEYLMDNIPPDAIMCVCGDSQVFMHLDEDEGLFSIDYDPLYYQPEYEGHSVEELCFEAE